MHYEGTFNKYAMMEEMGVHGIRDKSLRKFKGEGWPDQCVTSLFYYVAHVAEGESNIAYTL